jgi:hypothetical protein
MKLSDISVDVLRKCVDLCDGHTILDPQAFVNAGLPPELVAAHSVTHVSDPHDPKQQITSHKTGRQVEQMKGIYGLDFLFAVAGALKVQYASKFGRGSQARSIQEALYKHWGEA